jgi:hypothetical protein
MSSEQAIQTTQAVRNIGGVQTELCILQFSDRYMVFITQLNKPGTMVNPAILNDCQPSGDDESLL